MYFYMYMYAQLSVGSGGVGRVVRQLSRLKLVCSRVMHCDHAACRPIKHTQVNTELS